MQWALDFLPLPPCPELGRQPLSGVLWALLVLFLWYCYRVGSDAPVPRRAHAGKLKSGGARAGRTPRASGGGGEGTDAASGAARVAGGSRGTPCIPAETGEEEEEEEEAGRRRGYLTPVLGHALFPAQAPPPSRKLYSALQEYAKRYSWAGMGRIHKGLRDQVRGKLLIGFPPLSLRHLALIIPLTSYLFFFSISRPAWFCVLPF